MVVDTTLMPAERSVAALWLSFNYKARVKRASGFDVSGSGPAWGRRGLKFFKTPAVSISQNSDSNVIPCATPPPAEAFDNRPQRPIFKDVRLYCAYTWQQFWEGRPPCRSQRRLS